MVASKGKVKARAAVQDSHAFNNIMTAFQALEIYSDEVKNNSHPLKSSDIGIGALAKRPPHPRKSDLAHCCAEMLVSKENGVKVEGAKTKAGRKPLRDLTNTRISSRSRLHDTDKRSNTAKLNKLSQGKPYTGIYGLRTVAKETVSSRKAFRTDKTEIPFHQNLRGSRKDFKSYSSIGHAHYRKRLNTVASSTNELSAVRSKRKSLPSATFKATGRIPLKVIGLSSNSIGQSNKLMEVNSRVKSSRTRSLLSDGYKMTHALSRLNAKTHVKASSKTRDVQHGKIACASSNTAVCKVKKHQDGQCLKKEEIDPVCVSTGEKVTAIMSKPRNGRRKSYTSLLIEQSKGLIQYLDYSRRGEIPDIDNPKNHLEVTEYVNEIYEYYWTMEAQNSPLGNYMAVQIEITPRMRGILINWLTEVHFKFELMQETLFLMVFLLDRFLSMHVVKKEEMQLTGLTSLLLASKYEDYWHPKIKDLISISSDSYTREQVLVMEKLMLNVLKFRLNFPTPYVFMQRFLKAAQSGQKIEHLAFYLVELCLVEYEALMYTSSLLCSAAIYVARCTLGVTPVWTELLVKHTHYVEAQLKECAAMILRFQRAGPTGLLKVVYEKYLTPKRSCASTIKPLDELPP